MVLDYKILPFIIMCHVSKIIILVRNYHQFYAAYSLISSLLYLFWKEVDDLFFLKYEVKLLLAMRKILFASEKSFTYERRRNKKSTHFIAMNTVKQKSCFLFVFF